MFSVSVIYVVENQAVLLLQRSEFMRLHPNLICFPGGRFESDDTNFLMTAIRETKEETSILLPKDSLIKQLDSYVIYTGEIIHPFLFKLDQVPSTIELSAESKELIWLPKNIAVDKNNYKFNPLAKKHMLILNYQNKQIWGITASILYDVFVKYNYFKLS